MTSLPAAFLASRLLPVVTVESASGIEGLGEALVDGGLPTVEVTLRTPAGLPAIAALARAGRVLVGAGTVLDPAGVDHAVAAGARFLVSPGLDPDVVDRARHHDVPVLPGVATASEVQRAHRLGLRVCKFFPAELAGGVPMVRALGAPFPAMGFVPSGGVNPVNAAAYLAEPNVAAVSGSWMVPTDALSARDWSRVQRLCRDAVALAAAAV